MTDKELRELDRLVAEKVMGWNQVWSVHELNSKEDFCVSGAEQTCWIIERGNNITPFKPTTNAADALAVLKKCFVICNPIACGTKFCDGRNYFNVHGSVDGWIEANAPTLELAICLFAQQLFSKESK